MSPQRPTGPADLIHGPAVTQRLRVGAVRRQTLEGKECRGAGALVPKLLNRGPSVLETLDHDPLQSLAEHGFHRPLETGGHVE